MEQKSREGKALLMSFFFLKDLFFKQINRDVSLYLSFTLHILLHEHLGPFGIFQNSIINFRNMEKSPNSVIEINQFLISMKYMDNKNDLIH